MSARPVKIKNKKRNGGGSGSSSMRGDSVTDPSPQLSARKEADVLEQLEAEPVTTASENLGTFERIESEPAVEAVRPTESPEVSSVYGEMVAEEPVSAQALTVNTAPELDEFIQPSELVEIGSAPTVDDNNLMRSIFVCCVGRK